MDFTLTIYKSFLKYLISRDYSIISFKDFIYSKFRKNKNSFIILRHDVDRLPHNSLSMAEIEYSLGIKGSYYFRIVPESFSEEIIKQIADFGHEIGYHYEDIDITVKNEKLKIKNEYDREKLIDLAFVCFCKNLERMREIADIKTICMHGSPLSKYDNRMIWEKYNYKDLNLIGEPYYDIDFNELAYFTDTGRKWDGSSVSVRDKVNSKYNFSFKTTQDIIDNIDKLPNKIMFTIHPQRWNNDVLKWLEELVAQSGKNMIKKYFFVRHQP